MLKKATSFVGVPIVLLVQWVLREEAQRTVHPLHLKSNGSPVRLASSLLGRAGERRVLTRQGGAGEK